MQQPGSKRTSCSPSSLPRSPSPPSLALSPHPTPSLPLLSIYHHILFFRSHVHYFLSPPPLSADGNHRPSSAMGTLRLRVCPVLFSWSVNQPRGPEVRDGLRRHLVHHLSCVASALWSVEAHILTHLQSMNTNKPRSHFGPHNAGGSPDPIP